MSWFQTARDIRLVCEIASDYVAAARFQQQTVEAWAVQALPAGAVRPAPMADNVADQPAVQQALQQVVGAVGEGERACVLLVPDLLARVALLEFDQWPGRAEDAEGLLRWRLKKDLPFDVSQAALAYQVQPGRSAPHEVLAVTALRSLVQQYEACVEALGLQPGWVMPSTLAALGCVDGGGGARLLVKRDQNSLSLAIGHGDNVRLFRCLPLSASGGLGSDPLFEKVYPAVVFFQDQWEQPLSEVVLLGLEESEKALAYRFEQEASCSARSLSPEILRLPPDATSGRVPDHRIAPSLGWALGNSA
jgi:type IV pilus assembly protein PilM